MTERGLGDELAHPAHAVGGRVGVIAVARHPEPARFQAAILGSEQRGQVDGDADRISDGHLP